MRNSECGIRNCHPERSGAQRNEVEGPPNVGQIRLAMRKPSPLWGNVNNLRSSRHNAQNTDSIFIQIAN